MAVDAEDAAEESDEDDVEVFANGVAFAARGVVARRVVRVDARDVRGRGGERGRVARARRARRDWV